MKKVQFSPTVEICSGSVQPHTSAAGAASSRPRDRNQPKPKQKMGVKTYRINAPNVKTSLAKALTQMVNPIMAGGNRPHIDYGDVSSYEYSDESDHDEPNKTVQIKIPLFGRRPVKGKESYSACCGKKSALRKGSYSEPKREHQTALPCPLNSSEMCREKLLALCERSRSIDGGVPTSAHSGPQPIGIPGVWSAEPEELPGPAGTGRGPRARAASASASAASSSSPPSPTPNEPLITSKLALVTLSTSPSDQIRSFRSLALAEESSSDDDTVVDGESSEAPALPRTPSEPAPGPAPVPTPGSDARRGSLDLIRGARDPQSRNETPAPHGEAATCALTECCPDCDKGTAYGLLPPGHYHEMWTRKARVRYCEGRLSTQEGKPGLFRKSSKGTPTGDPVVIFDDTGRVVPQKDIERQVETAAKERKLADALHTSSAHLYTPDLYESGTPQPSLFIF